jgi:hypothetical protein
LNGNSSVEDGPRTSDASYLPIKASRFQASIAKKPPATAIDVVFPINEIERSTMTDSSEVPEASSLDDRCPHATVAGLEVVEVGRDHSTVPTNGDEAPVLTRNDTQGGSKLSQGTVQRKTMITNLSKYSIAATPFCNVGAT